MNSSDRVFPAGAALQVGLGRGPEVGLGKGFAPSIEAANAALGNVVRTQPHPGGVEGTRFSLQEMCKAIYAGRNDPRIRGWSGRVLMEAGKPKGEEAQAQAILDALRKKTIYQQDPVNSEMIVKPHVTLCLDEHGLCIPSADCDDLVTAMTAALLSQGIPAVIVGQAFNGSPAASHVICAVKDSEKGWLKIDPSHATWPVGKSHPASKEFWVDPITGEESDYPGGPVTKLGKEPPGDFVGVGAIPFAHAFALDEGPEQKPADAGYAAVGALPFAHQFALDEGPEQGSTNTDLPRYHCLRYGPEGLGQGMPAAQATGTLDGDAIDYFTSQLQDAVYRLEVARNNLGAALQEVTRTRLAMRGQDYFDPEPAIAITSVAEFPAGGQVWSQAMDSVANQTFDVADRMVGFGHDALSGNRQVFIDSVTGAAFIQSLTTDPWSLHAVVDNAQSLILGFFDSSGKLLSGVDAKTGQALTAAQVGTMQAAKTVGVQGVQFILGIVGVAALGVATYLVWAKWCDAITAVAKETTRQGLQQLVATGKAPSSVIHQNEQDELAAQQANAAANPVAADLTAAGSIFEWIAIGGIAVSAAVVLGPLVKAWVMARGVK